MLTKWNAFCLPKGNTWHCFHAPTSSSTVQLLFCMHNLKRLVFTKQQGTSSDMRNSPPARLGGRQKWSADDHTGRSADYLQTTPALCDVTLELTGDIFFRLSRAKWETELGTGQGGDVMEPGLSHHLVSCYWKLMARDDCCANGSPRSAKPERHWKDNVPIKKLLRFASSWQSSSSRHLQGTEDKLRQRLEMMSAAVVGLFRAESQWKRAECPTHVWCSTFTAFIRLTATERLTFLLFTVSKDISSVALSQRSRMLLFVFI